MTDQPRTEPTQESPSSASEIVNLYRRENLRALIKEHGANRLARKIGYSNASYLSQMAGPAPIRNITESTARKIEEALDLQPFSLDSKAEISELKSWKEIAFKDECIEDAEISVGAAIACIDTLFEALSNHQKTAEQSKIATMLKLILKEAAQGGDIEKMANELISLL